MDTSPLSPRRQPFVYLTLALGLGIFVERTDLLPLPVAVVVTAITVVGGVRSAIRFRPAVLTTFLLFSISICGAALSHSNRNTIETSRLKALFDQHVLNDNEPVELTGILASAPEPAPDSYFLDLDTRSVLVGNELEECSGHLRIAVVVDDQNAVSAFQSLALDYGSEIRVRASLEHARAYHNPGSPDFNEFLERHGYDLKATVTPALIQRMGSVDVNPVLARLFHMRLLMMEILDRRFEATVAGTLKAMLTGNRYYLDARVEERLREGATFHVLVISGLHVGVIAFALIALVDAGLAGRSRGSLSAATIRTLVALVGLWGYVAMVGLAPPVTRAATMLSLSLIGPLLFRRNVSINSLALSAFVMMSLNPALIADPGFQLSFAAVGGIVGLALPINRQLQRIGEWRPSPSTPRPPACPRVIRLISEAAYWDQRRFEGSLAQSAIAYQPHKSHLAVALNSLRIQPILRGALGLIITSAAIQLTTLPLSAFYFNRVSPVGVLLNIFAGLLTFVLMLGSFLVIAVDLVVSLLHYSPSSFFFVVLTWPVSTAHSLLTGSITPLIQLPVATFRVAHYEGAARLVYALYYTALVALVKSVSEWSPILTRLPANLIKSIASATVHESSEIPRDSVTPQQTPFSDSKAIASLAVFLIAAALVVYPPPQGPTGKLAIHFLDVGQGDSALVVLPGGGKMLVDGGGELTFGSKDKDPLFAESLQANDPDATQRRSSFHVGEAVVSRFLWALHFRRVDYILATHADADHIGGLSDVVSNFRVGEALVGHVPTNDAEFEQFRKNVNRNKTPISSLESGQQFLLQGVRVQVLWPPRGEGASISSRNNDSVVLRLEYGSTAVVLAGDIELAAEQELVRSGLNLHADVLKVPHHGSKTSSSEAFLDAVNPQCAVISVGERSRFGHPHQVVVDRYLSRSIRLFQTGIDGTVTLESDGASISFSTFKARDR